MGWWWYDDNSDYETRPVGQKQANAWGLYDMSGNVFEWCTDEFDYSAYNGRTSVRDPLVYRPGASGRVIRGGGWYNGAVYCRVSYRRRSSPDYRGDVLGLRLSRSLD